MLLDAVADKWGVDAGPGGGKTVWFECAVAADALGALKYTRPNRARTTTAPPTASSTQWLPVATMAMTVNRGWRRPRAFIHGLGATRAITRPHQGPAEVQRGHRTGW
ncbi:hypothetical protein SGLAM104S_00199 [Streptomyces glaucescens]